MADRLERYRGKRDPGATPEPAGDAHAAPPEGARRFVVQEHHARRLHWDLRLEHDGVLASWAVPRGIPPGPERNHLAVRTEDHPLEYLDFHGEIPAGQYGAGTMAIWDRGTYEEHKFRDDEVMITFHGERVRGRYVLFRTKGDDWMIHRMDPPEDPEREPMPEELAPMLARTGPLPPDDGRWAFEIKWDGVRAIAFVQGGRLVLKARSGRDISARYPELRPIAAALAGREVVLDGEVVAFDGARTSFARLAERGHRDVAVFLYVFDVVWLDGHDVRDLPLRTRKRLLRAALEFQDGVRLTPYRNAAGEALFAEACRKGWEGVIAKRADSPYRATRSRAWLKFKCDKSQELVIGGFTAPRGSRIELGALLLGYYDGDALRYAGKVGTGFDRATLRDLGGRLRALRRDEPPFADATSIRERGVTWVHPELVGQVAFTEWTGAGRLRHPRFLGLRDDKSAREVVREG
jgi:bifunctional non-homologous end joining protein LigD